MFSSQQSFDGGPKLALRRADQVAAAVVLAGSLLAIAVWWGWQVRLGGRLIEIETAPPLPADFRLDVNRAEAAELSLLPGIGPALAERIIEERGARGGFRDVTDLRDVRGVGAKTFEGIRPYLLPLERNAAVPEAEKDGPAAAAKLD